MNLPLLSKGYPLANIQGDIDSRQAYYSHFALIICTDVGRVSVA
jgi:hypothetical protein